MDYTSKELLKEYKDAWIPSLPLDLLPLLPQNLQEHTTIASNSQGTSLERGLGALGVNGGWHGADMMFK